MPVTPLAAALPPSLACGIAEDGVAVLRLARPHKRNAIDDATVEGSRSAGEIGAYIDELRQGVEWFPTTMHFMGNQIVSVDGDEGHVETYAVAYHWKAEQAGGPDDANLVVGVRYHDRVVRTPQGWRIAIRRVSPDWRQGPYPPV